MALAGRADGMTLAEGGCKELTFHVTTSLLFFLMALLPNAFAETSENKFANLSGLLRFFNISPDELTSHVHLRISFQKEDT